MRYESQRIAWWFFATCMLLLTLQLIYGFIMGFARIGWDDLHPIIPFNAARATHTNLLVMWLLCGFMGAAYYIIPEESGRELHSVPLAKLQLGALVATGVTAVIGFHFNWWEGRKFLEIPRPLDFLVVVDVLAFIANIAMTVWTGRRRTTTSMVLFFGLLCAALLYLPGMIPTDNQSADSYWRWWVVHLWVEGFFEVFAVAVMSFLFVKLGLVRGRTATINVLFATIVFMAGGILGTFHHLYFAGTTTGVIALGASISALEVVPLALIGMEAYETWRHGRATPWMQRYRWPIMFFLAVSFWNLVGAGLFGFLINTPLALYYMQGLNLTPLHGHTALFGVYGMLGIGLMLFCLRGLKPDAVWPEGLLRGGFWCLNIGLVLMGLLTLLPMGVLQLQAALEHGYWYARSAEFMGQPLIHMLVWMRVPGDTLFSVGALMVSLFVASLWLGRRNAARLPEA